MEVTVEAGAGLERRMRVVVPEDRLRGEVDKRLQELARQARIPGFRPGKVPMKVITQRFGRQVRSEVMGDMIQSSFYDALAQEKLRPAGTPTIEPSDGDDGDGDGLRYTAVFDVYPEVELPAFESLSIARPVCEIGEENVERMIENLRSQRRTWAQVERAASEHDRVVVDFEGFRDGEALDGTKAEKFPVELGAERMVPGFEAGLLGAAAGEERTIEVTFPQDYHSSDLAGQAVTFNVKVHQVEESALPELDADFAESFGVKEGGVDALRGEVRSNMERQLVDTLRGMTKQRTMDALMANRELELPRALIEEESKRALERRRLEMSHSGMDPESVELDPADFAEEARTRVTLGLVLAELIKEHDIRADPAKVRARIESIAATYEQPDEVIGWYYGNRDRLGDIETSVLEDEVVDWILERAQVTEDRVDFDSLMNPEASA